MRDCREIKTQGVWRERDRKKEMFLPAAFSCRYVLMRS
jgi:hypothetical protein